MSTTISRTATAALFGVALTTVDAWIRAGAPVVRRGSRGVAWELDPSAIAKWLKERGGASELAQREFWQAKLLEQRYRGRAANLLDRAAVEKAAERMLAQLGARIGQLPEALERRAGLSAPQVAEARRIVSALLDSLPEKLRERAGL